MRKLAIALVLCLFACDREPPRAAVRPPLPRALVATPTQTPGCRASADGVDVSADRVLSGPIAFDLFAGAVAPESLPIVDAVARRLRECAAVQLEIEVHTEAFRTSVFNARASQRVAEALRDRLVAGGVAASRLVPCGYGESRLLTQAAGLGPRPVNARVEWRRVPAASAFACPPVPE
jgi:outer membrane protein OmpA-like peptidoglycan-associated protein